MGGGKGPAMYTDYTLPVHISVTNKGHGGCCSRGKSGHTTALGPQCRVDNGLSRFGFPTAPLPAPMASSPVSASPCPLRPLRGSHSSQPPPHTSTGAPADPVAGVTQIRAPGGRPGPVLVCDTSPPEFRKIAPPPPPGQAATPTAPPPPPPPASFDR